ncbi:hypothetical protein FB451DRAFT_1180556 [Mycena latifolia]|nr:hypothetical protein FB451DRAFT_1180556 [Mycena latifolia]
MWYGRVSRDARGAKIRREGVLRRRRMRMQRQLARMSRVIPDRGSERPSVDPNNDNIAENRRRGRLPSDKVPCDEGAILSSSGLSTENFNEVREILRITFFGNLFALEIQTQIDWSVYRQACLHKQTVTGLASTKKKNKSARAGSGEGEGGRKREGRIRPRTVPQRVHYFARDEEGCTPCRAMCRLPTGADLYKRNEASISAYVHGGQIRHIRYFLVDVDVAEIK